MSSSWQVLIKCSMKARLWKASQHAAHERIIYLERYRLLQTYRLGNDAQPCHTTGQTVDNLLACVGKVIKKIYQTFSVWKPFNTYILPLRSEGRRCQVFFCQVPPPWDQHNHICQSALFFNTTLHIPLPTLAICGKVGGNCLKHYVNFTSE